MKGIKNFGGNMIYDISLPNVELLRSCTEDINWASVSEKVLSFHTIDIIREFKDYIDWTDCLRMQRIPKKVIMEFNREIEDAINEKHGQTWRRGKHFTWWNIKESYLYD